jgi:glutamate racemase
VLTTRATAEGELYRRVTERYAANVRVITQVAPELVRMVEENSQDIPSSRQIIWGYIRPLLDAGADQIALACTHFPFLANVIQEMAGQGVSLIDPGPAIARQAARVWPPELCAASGENVYFTSGSPATLGDMLRTLIAVDSPVHGVCWDHEVPARISVASDSAG